MKLLSRVYDHSEAICIAERMRDKGIATFIRAAGAPRAPDQWVVFVCLASQVDEAVRVLGDPDYEPANRIDVAAFEAELPSSHLGLLVKWCAAILLGILLLFAAISLLSGK